MSDVQQRIQEIVAANRVVLFMKGTPDFPQCGFSDLASRIVQSLGVDFQAVNVLLDEEIRQGIKDFGNWPTIPQLYIDGQLVGGSDILRDMYESGELKQLVAAK